MSSSRNESVEYIYTAFITLKNGKRIYASQYGLKAFYIPVKRSSNCNLSKGCWRFHPFIF